MGLPLHFIRNLTSGDWVGAPVEGLEEGDFDAAHPFVSLGQAIGVTEHLRREGRRASKRLIGFLTRREEEEYDIVTLTLGSPNDQLEDCRGETAEAPDDEEFEDGDFDDEPFEDDSLQACVARRMRRFLGRRPRQLVEPDGA